ncbi:MAG: AAA family ATPase [Firmicutes bacterium]|nr:AAA family ATPase [Bacillota bacterium]
MNTKKNLIIIKGEIQTARVKFCRYNPETKRMDVEFNSGERYPYAYASVEWLKEPQALNPNLYQISKDGCYIDGIEGIYVFKGALDTYWHICFEDGREADYKRNELHIVESCLSRREAKNVFTYIKQIANLSEIKNKETGENILVKQLEKLAFIGNDIALAKYLDPSLLSSNKISGTYAPIFPFGCNNSQYQAVKRAMENQISVIEGPPGTGKTQTILNILANILMEGKTVQIVSNNNGAIENVYEKLSSPKYDLGFIVATLGKWKNKEEFIEQQDGDYPDFASWKQEEDPKLMRKRICEKSLQLENVFNKREKLAELRKEQAQLLTELEYFNQYTERLDKNSPIFRRRLSSKCWMALWQECQMIAEKRQTVGLWFPIKAFFQYGITDMSFYKQDIGNMITTLQAMYYHEKGRELAKQLEEVETILKDTNRNLLDDLCNQSMELLKDALARKYENKEKRTIFDEKDFWKKPYDVLAEYPVILSTTFSSRTSLNTEVVYDYLIMDEASQVDVATGALALSGARNVVIVGDTKQLSNIVTGDAEIKAKAIFDSFMIDDGYQFTKSFLQSMLDVMPNVTKTLLREHYRCHPKIIDFCNQKFYRGELIIMTEDKGEKDVLTAIRTVPGNHARDRYSQRQIDVIKNEIIPNYVEDKAETGIIAPYKNQVEALEREIKGIEVATVHKFQGREKDTIIISTVDDEISDFADDPYLINVAVSRAKKKLMLVATGNKQVKERNITDLIEYIQYHNFEVTDSKIYSVFDYLYKQYEEARNIYLQKHKRVSKHESENLMYALIMDILSERSYASLDVVCHFPMNMLIRDLRELDERELQYVMNPATHIDFLIYNRISKRPLLAIEVDGYEYHKKGTIQAERDLIKNHILELYEMPLLRFQTNGSGEKECMIEMLNKLIG